MTAEDPAAALDAKLKARDAATFGSTAPKKKEPATPTTYKLEPWPRDLAKGRAKALEQGDPRADGVVIDYVATSTKLERSAAEKLTKSPEENARAYSEWVKSNGSKPLVLKRDAKE